MPTCLKILKPLIIPAFKGKISHFIKFIILTFLSFILIISWMPIASGQIPFLNTNQTKTENNVIDILNRPYTCDNFVCSKVWFYGLPIFEVSSYPTDAQDRDKFLSVENRAKHIQNNLRRILKLTLAHSINPQTTVSENPEIQENDREKETVKPETNNIKKFTNYQNSKNQIKTTEIEIQTITHPNTPNIKVGTFNGETVIYFPTQFGSPQQIIATVTKADALHYNQTIEQLAQVGQNTISSVISLALHERDFDTKNKFFKPIIIIILVGIIILLSFSVLWVQRRCQTHHRNICYQLEDLEKSLTFDPECGKIEELATISSPPKLQLNQQQKPHVTNSNISRKTKKNIFLNSAIANQIFLDIQLNLLWQAIPKISLRKQNILKQELNIVIFIRRLLRWIQGFIWVWGIGGIMFLYPQTRAISFLLIGEPINILVIWVFVSLADKVSDFVIDFYLHKWAENAQLANHNSGRYALRVPTYSAALTNMTTMLSCLIGIVATAEILGIATQVLASAGVIAAVSAYFSQNLIKDVINGVLILWNDRYAVGDVVTIGTEGGLVEKMNLYMTALRSPDGELITIPHGSITFVKNLTKNWSRVNFTIEIAYDANIKKAMETIREVAETMQNEPEWRDNFIEPATVLGVDGVSHSGILIRVWIKTLPLQQWIVGREFRLRVKEAFDRENIAIGVPQRSLSVQNFSDFSNGKHDRKNNLSYSSVK